MNGRLASGNNSSVCTYSWVVSGVLVADKILNVIGNHDVLVNQFNEQMFRISVVGQNQDDLIDCQYLYSIPENPP